MFTHDSSVLSKQPEEDVGDVLKAVFNTMPVSEKYILFIAHQRFVEEASLCWTHGNLCCIVMI